MDAFIVYIIYSAKFDKFYIGFTSNLEARLLSHNHLATKGFTIKYRPWTLVWSETFGDKKTAMDREKYLKSLKSKIAIQKLLGW